MKASIYDAFKAAADFGNTALSISDGINQEKAKAELQSAELSMQKQFNDYLLGLSGRSDFDRFGTDWENQKISILNGVTKSLSSPYARENASMMFQQMDQNQQYKIQVESTKRSADYTFTTVQNNNNTIMASLSYTKDEKLMQTEQNWKGLYESGIISYADYNQKSMENGATIALDTLQQGAREILKTAGVEEAMKFIQTNQDKLILANGAEVPMGNIREIAEKNIWGEWQTSEALRKQRQEEAWSKNENNASQIYLQMLSGGGVPSALQGLQYLKSIGGTGLDSNRRDEYALKFQNYLNDAAKDPAGATIKAQLQMTVNDIVAGWQAGRWTAEQGKDLLVKKLQSGLNEQFAIIDKNIAAGKKVDTSGVDYARGKDALQVYPTALNDYFEAIQKAAPEPIREYIANIKTSTESIYRTARGIDQKKGLSNEQMQEFSVIQADLAGFAFDLLNESTFGKLTPAEMDKKVSERVKIAVAKEFDIFQTGIFEIWFNSEEKQAAEMQAKLDSGVDPVFVDTYGKENWTGKSKEAVETLRNFQRKELSKKLGLSETDVGRISVTNEPTKDGRDATGSAIYSDTKTGNQYRFRTEGEKMIGEQRASGSGTWAAFELSKEQGKIDAAAAATAKTEANKTPPPGTSQSDWNKLDANQQALKWDEYNRRERTKSKIDNARANGGR